MINISVEVPKCLRHWDRSVWAFRYLCQSLRTVKPCWSVLFQNVLWPTSLATLMNIVRWISINVVILANRFYCLHTIEIVSILLKFFNPVFRIWTIFFWVVSLSIRNCVSDQNFKRSNILYFGKNLFGFCITMWQLMNELLG